MNRPPTHDDPNAIPRNGTEVPWVDLPDPGPEDGRPENPAGDDDGDTAAEEPPQRR